MVKANVMETWQEVGHLQMLHKMAFCTISLCLSAIQNFQVILKKKSHLDSQHLYLRLTQKELAISQKDTEKVSKTLKLHTWNCPPCIDHKLLQLPPLTANRGQYCDLLKMDGTAEFLCHYSKNWATHHKEPWSDSYSQPYSIWFREVSFIYREFK